MAKFKLILSKLWTTVSAFHISVNLSVSIFHHDWQYFRNKMLIRSAIDEISKLSHG